MGKKISQSPEIMAFLLYSCSHFFILLNNGVYWDGWVLYESKKEVVQNIYKQILNHAGFVASSIHNLILSAKQSVTLYHILTFVIYGLAIFFLGGILRKIKEIDKLSRFFILTFFAIFPLNMARISIINFSYCICYLVFYASFFILTEYLNNKNIIYRILSLLGFFFSFLTNSLLFFYLTIFFYIFYHHRNEVKKADDVIRVMLKYIDFIMLPVVFWSIRNGYFQPTGFQKYRNSITASRIVRGFGLSLISYFYSFFDIIYVSFRSMTFIVLAFILAASSFIAKLKKTTSYNLLTDTKLFTTGVVFFYIAILPYCVVSKLPQLKDWHSRHQLLIPLGASLMLFYGIKLLSNLLKLKKELTLVLFVTFVAAFIFYNNKIYLDYQRDWYKQLSVMDKMKNSAIFYKNTSFLFKDETKDLDAMNRRYRFYEYTGMMKHVFGDEKRFGIDHKFVMPKDLNDVKGYFCAAYSLKDYVYSKPQYLITIRHGTYNLNYRSTLKLIFASYFMSKKFNDIIKNIVDIEYSPLGKQVN